MPIAFKREPLTMEQWQEILKVYAEERACAHCYACYIRKFLTRPGLLLTTFNYIQRYDI